MDGGASSERFAKRGSARAAVAEVGATAGEPPAREAWRLIAELLFSEVAQTRFQAACAAAKLSPPQLKALVSLEAGGAQPMRVLAKGWGCDASWVTGIVDGLEERGYVERRVLPTDRRVKVVHITAQGEEAKARALACLHDPPPEVAALDDHEQVALRDLLRKICRPPAL